MERNPDDNSASTGDDSQPIIFGERSFGTLAEDVKDFKPNRAMRRHRQRHHPLFTKRTAWEAVEFLNEYGLKLREEFIQKRRNKGKKRKKGQKPR